jgi:phospholipase/lecithinase/hemolysin
MTNPAPQARFTRAFLRGAALATCLAFTFGAAAPLAAGGQQNKARPKPLFSALYVFGDSLSDTGRLYAATYELTGGAYGIPPSPAYYNGRTSNGPLWAEYLAPALGLEYDELDNFAWAGANTGRINAWEEDFGVDFPGMLDEVDEFVVGLGRHRKADKKALYVVFGGSNDFFRILAGGEDPNVVIPEAVVNIVRIVLTLRLLGAEHIVVVNLPDLGLTPRVRAIDASVPGTAATVTYLSVTFNTLLDQALNGLRCDVGRVDAFATINAWVADPVAYGFTNVTDIGLLSGTDGDTYLFWDDIHPTTRAHALLAGVIADAIDDAAGKKCRLHGFDPRPRFAWCGPRG